MLIWVVPGTAPSGGMDFKVLNWKRRQRRCRRMRNKLSGERDGDGDEEVERYLHRPESWWCA